MKTGVKSIDAVLVKAESFLNEKMVYYKKVFIARDLEWNDRVEQRVRLDIIFDLVKSLSKNFKDSDEVLDVCFKTGMNGSVIISCSVMREGTLYGYISEVIHAGGYNIQVSHYRYIVKTNLPKSQSKTAIDVINEARKKMNKEDRIREDIARYEKYIVTETETLAVLKSKTQEQVWEESGNERFGVYCPENTYFTSKEHHAKWFNEIKEDTQKSHVNKIEYTTQRIQYLIKEKQKHLNKLEALLK